MSVFPGLACGWRKGARVWGALGRDGEWAAAHANPWVPRCLEAGSTRAVCAGEGRKGRRGATEPCGCSGLGEEGRQRRKGGDPKALGWGSEAVAELGREGEVLRAVSRDTARVGCEPRYWRRGLPKWVRQAPASGLLPRALLGVQTRAVGGLGSVRRKAGCTSLCGPGGPAPYPASGVPLDWVVSGLPPMCLGPPALTWLMWGRTRPEGVWEPSLSALRGL